MIDNMRTENNGSGLGGYAKKVVVPDSLDWMKESGLEREQYAKRRPSNLEKYNQINLLN